MVVFCQNVHTVKKNGLDRVLPGPQRQGVVTQRPKVGVQNERRKAFADGIKKYPGLKIIDSQSGNFERSLGKQVMEAFLKKHGKAINIVYAHNDDMALGAAQAIEEAGLKPGKDITLVSIDAIGEAVKAVAEGRLNCTVECSPLFGPKVYDTVAQLLKGEKVPKKIYNKDELFDSNNAAKALPSRQY